MDRLPTWLEPPEPPNDIRDGTDDVVYLTGYSVSSGEFAGDGQTAYVAGAPRAAHGYGKVRIGDLYSTGMVGSTVSLFIRLNRL